MASEKTQHTPLSIRHFNQSDVVTGVVTRHIHGHNVAFREQQVNEGKWAPVPVSSGTNQLLLLSGTEGLLCVKCWILHQSNWQLLHLNYTRRWRGSLSLPWRPLKSQKWDESVMEYCWSPSEIYQQFHFANNHWLQRKPGEEVLKHAHSEYYSLLAKHQTYFLF